MKKIIVFIFLLLRFFIVQAQYKNAAFIKPDVKYYLHTVIDGIVRKMLLLNNVDNNILFFFKFNIDSLGNVENVHFSNEDPPVNYNQIKDTLSDPNRTIQLNHLIDSAMRNPSKHGYWAPAKNGNIPCKSKTMFVQVVYQPSPDPFTPKDSYFYFPLTYIRENNYIVSFFKTNEEMIFLGCLYVNGFVQY